MLRYLIILLGMVALSFSCTSEEPPGSGKSSNKPANTDEGSAGEDDGDLVFDDCKKDSDSEEAETDSDEEESGDDELFLTLAEAEFEGEDGVKEYLKEKCYTCHKEDGSALPLDTYELSKDNIDGIIDRMELDDTDSLFMPPGGSSDSKAIKLLKDWRDADFPEGEAPSEDTDDDGEGDDDGSSSSSSDPCGGSGSTGGDTSSDGSTSSGSTDNSGDEGDDFEPNPELFEPFINPPKRKDCTEQGLVYERDKNACTIPLSEMECTWDNILPAFGNSSAIKTAKANYDAEGFIVDQCGVADGSKLKVFLYCLAAKKESEGGTCVPKEQLTDSVFIQTRAFQQK